MVATYLSSGTVARAYLGRSACRFCGERNGSLEFTDGRYIWPEGLAHYVTDHGVRLPDDFVEYAVARLDEVEAAEVETAWWQSQTGR